MGWQTRLCSDGFPSWLWPFPSFSPQCVSAKLSELTCFGKSYENGKLDYWKRLHGQSSALDVFEALLLLMSDLSQISEWILLLAAFALVGLRVYTRLFVQRQKLRLSEYVLLFSALIGLGLIICE